MNILYPLKIDSYWPIGTIHREIGKRIQHDVTAFVSKKDNIFDYEDVEVIPISGNKLEKALKYSLESLNASEYDVIHTGPRNYNVITGLRQIGTSTIHIHTIHNAKWGIDRGISPFVCRRTLVSLCDQLTTVSPYAASVAYQHTGARNEPIVIPNGVDIARFNSSQADTISKRILYIGRSAERKHPKLIAEIASILPEYHFRVRISGLKKMEALHRDLQSLNNVKILSHLSQGELCAEYASAEFFLAPYEKEGFGMTVLEALASGTPVIGYSSGNLPTLLNNNAGVIIKNLEPSKWANSIRINQDFARMNRKSIEKDARNFAEGYSWDKVSSQYTNLYQNIINE